jgi:hypothetical protein
MAWKNIMITQSTGNLESNDLDFHWDRQAMEAMKRMDMDLNSDRPRDLAPYFGFLQDVNPANQSSEPTHESVKELFSL